MVVVVVVEMKGEMEVRALALGEEKNEKGNEM